MCSVILSSWDLKAIDLVIDTARQLVACIDGRSRSRCHHLLGINPLDPSLLGITASPTEPPGAIDLIADIIINHILTFKDSTQLS